MDSQGTSRAESDMKCQLDSIRIPSLTEYPIGSIPIGYSVRLYSPLGDIEDWSETLEESVDFFCNSGERCEIFAIYEREGSDGKTVTLYSRWLDGCWQTPVETELIE